MAADDEEAERALEPLLDALPRLGWSGKRDAIELLDEIGDLRAGPALLSLLGNETDRWLRAWAAAALGGLNVEQSIPDLTAVVEDPTDDPLVRAYAAVALDRLGATAAIGDLLALLRAEGVARQASDELRMALESRRANQVTPSRLEALSRESHALITPPRVWPLSVFDEAVLELASAQQLLLRFQFYEWEEPGTWSKSESPWSQGPAELDFALSWAELVESATAQALDASTFAGRSTNALAALTWTDRPDERLLSDRPHARRRAGIPDQELKK